MESLWWPPLRYLGDSGSFRVAEFLSVFSGFFGALLMAGKPEIQKQQKIATGSWVHWVNRLVQICSKVYESSSKTWKSHINMHGASRNYRYIWDVSPMEMLPSGLARL